MNDTQYHSNVKCSKCHEQSAVYFTSESYLVSIYPYLCSTCRNKIRVELRNVFYKKII